MMTRMCPGCGCEDVNFWFDGDEYWCQDCYEKMKEEDDEEKQ